MIFSISSYSRTQKVLSFSLKLAFFMLVFLFSFLSAKAIKADDEIPYAYDKQPISGNLYVGKNSVTGSFNYEYIIDLPPGRNNMTPDLKLVYDSNSGTNQDLFGYGWSINIPYIERINRTGTDDLYSQNYYYSSLSGELEPNTTSTVQMSMITLGELIGYNDESADLEATGKPSNNLLDKVKMALGVEIQEDPLKLKTSKDRILASYDSDWLVYDMETKTTENRGQIKVYLYATDNEVAPAKYELIEKRTKNTQFFEIPDGRGNVVHKAKIYSGEPFYQDYDGKWYQTETATTTIEAFNDQTKISLLDGLKDWLIGAPAYASTDVVYSGAGDGCVRYDTTSTTWNTAVTASSGHYAHYIEDWLTPSTFWNDSGSRAQIYRGFLTFNTSDLPDDASITSAFINLWANLKVYDDNDANAYSVVVAGTQATSTELTVDDYDEVDSEEISNSIRIEDVDTGMFNNYTTYGDNQYILNATGTAAISTTSFSKFALREGHDLNNDQPSSTSNNYPLFASSEKTGTNLDPYLEIEYITAYTPSEPTSLQVEGLTNPVNLSDTTPEFSAIYNDPNAGDEADYYQIQVTASSTDWENLLWDSGKTALSSQLYQGNRSEDISYNGSSLEDGEIYYWRIRFWDDEDNTGVWSIGSDYFSLGYDYYGAKADNGDFLLYDYHDGLYWTVTDKLGTVYTFGYSTTSKQYIEPYESNVYRWMLEEVRDTNDNYIKYEYYKDDNQIYPAKITYTGNGETDGIFEIDFLREERDDNPVMYNTGFPVRTDYRINEIDVKINGVLTRKYELAYTTGDGGYRSALETITQTGWDEQSSSISLPDTILGYASKQAGWTTDTGYSIPEYFVFSQYDRGVRFADVNGDGLQDLIRSNRVDGNDYVATYINNGDGTGWTEDSNYDLPEWIVYNGVDYGTQIVDVNGDGLADVIKSFITSGEDFEDKVYINDGDGTGWTYDADYEGIFAFERYGYGDQGVRLADVNGDGLVDMIQSRSDSAIVGINKGDGTGWESDYTYTIPESFISDTHNDLGVRLADVNGDGLVDMLRAYKNGGTEINKIYINQGDGSGWVYNSDYSFPDWILYNGMDMGMRLGDINGDGLVDVVKSFQNSDTSEERKVFINQGDGTGWAYDDDYEVPELFTKFYGGDRGTRLIDVDGDGLDDFIRSQENYDVLGNDYKSVHISDNRPTDLVNSLTTSQGASSSIIYKPSTAYLDGSDDLLSPDLPLILQTVSEIGVNDGFGNIATSTFEYIEGDYYFNDPYDRKMSGFGQVVKYDPYDNETIAYYHQGNDSNSTQGEYSDDFSKIGKLYREEIYDDSDNLYQKTINKWENYDLGDDRDFVKLTRSVIFDYDGDEDHKDKAFEYTYSNTYGNLTQKIEWGQVTASDDGTFSDSGSDDFTTTYSYAASSTPYIIGLPSQETVADHSSTTVKDTKYYYDDLSFGDVNIGNLTKTEFWKSSTNWIDTENSYNSYGLVTQTKDPRDKATNFVYDEYNLYVATSTNPLSQSTDFYYDYSSGQVKKTVDPNGLAVETVYDGLDRITAQKQPDIDTPSSLVNKATFSYTDTLGSRKIVETNYLDGSNSFEVYKYLDGFDRVTQSRKEAESADTFAIKDFCYNDVGLLEKESWPYFSTGSSKTAATTTDEMFTRFTYDPQNRVVTTINAVGTTTNDYDQWVVTITDAEDNSKDYYYNAYNNLVQVDEHNATSTYSTEYEYNYLDNLTQITDAEDNLRQFTYDALGRRLTAQDLHASGDSYYGTWTYTYDDSGNLTQKQDPKSQTVNYTYDDINRVLTEDYTGDTGTEVSYAYDLGTYGIGRLSVATSTSAVTKFEYNALGLVETEIRIIDPEGEMHMAIMDTEILSVPEVADSIGMASIEPKIDNIAAIFSQAQTIKQTYELEEAVFIKRQKDKNDVQIEVGDKTKDTLVPELNISKWDGEVGFKIRPRPGSLSSQVQSLELDGYKIKLKTPNEEYHFYDIDPSETYQEGAYEFEVVWDKKPDSNIVEFDIETKNLAFYYQPEITDEEAELVRKERKSLASLSLEQVKRKIRPENVVGSYAVYHQENTGDYSKLGGKNYKSGKAFHIYRPKIVDSQGSWVWGKLNIDKQSGTLSIEIPQEFLGSASYPVTVDPTFGYTTIGSSWGYIGDTIKGSVFTAPENGSVSSITMYSDNVNQGTAEYMKYGMYLSNNLSYLDKTEEGSGNTTNDWVQLDFDTPVSITDGTGYILVCHASENQEGPSPTYDTGSANQGVSEWTGYETWTNPLDPSYSTNKYTIYATYTADAQEQEYITHYDYDRQGNITLITLPDSSEVRYTYNTAGLLESISSKLAGEGSYTDIIVDFDYSPLEQITYQEYNNSIATTNTYDQNELYRLKNKTTAKLGVGASMLSFPYSFQEEGTFPVLFTLEDLQTEPVVSENDILSKYNQAELIQQDYELQQSAFVKKTKDKDDVLIEVGDKQKDKFTPELNISRWDKEVEFTIKPQIGDTTQDDQVLILDGDKIKLKTTDKEYHFYDIEPSESYQEGAYEFEVVWDTKPDSNVALFDIETKNLDFYYQPEITDEEAELVRKERKSLANLTLEQVKRKIRPENVVGSYAVYHATKAGNFPGDKNYKSGKAFHIYRPKVHDSDGNWVWAEMNIDENQNVLSITIPQEFLDNASYPVTVDPTFGYTSTGSSWEYIGVSIEGSVFTAPADGTVSSITMFSDNVNQGTAEYMKYGMYLHNDLSFIDKTEQGSANTSNDWVQLDFDTPVAITNVTDYILVCHASENDEGPSPAYDTGAANQGHYEWVGSYESWSNPFDPSHDTDKFSIYATYTANSAPSEPTDLLAEGQTNPIGVTDTTPEFSAIYQDDDSGDSAIYYQLQVATSTSYWDDPEWDSTKSGIATTTEGTRSPDISYGGSALEEDGSTYYWRIKFWDDSDEEGSWSTTTASFVMNDAGGSIDVFQDITYTYDNVGNITRIVDSSETDAYRTIDYIYDDLYRLTNASTTDAATAGFTRSYAYDSLGNITNKSDQGNYLYQGDTGTRYENPHAVTSINGVGLTYDNNGNLVDDSTWDYTWNYDNRLIEADSGSADITYSYDHTGQRVIYSDGSNTTYYPNRYYNTEGATTTIHVFAGDLLIATIEKNGTATTTNYIHTDHLSGSNVITDEEGDVAQLLDYYPFGDKRVDEQYSGFEEQRQFTGHEYDGDTDLEYMVNRYYSNNLGKFLSQDSWEGDLANPQSLNKYSYVTNNPLKLIDPLGLRPKTEHESKVYGHMQNLQRNSKLSGDTEGVEFYQNAKSAYSSAIESLPDGGDPKWFTIANDAMFKWYDNQMGYANWARESGIESNYYTNSDPNDYKCNFFIGEVLKDSVGYKNDMHGWFGKNPPLASDWVKNKVKGFSSVESPQMGDVISFDNPRGYYDHVGFFLGNGVYISVTDSGGSNGHVTDGIRIKYIPHDSYKNNQINYNRLNN